MKELIITKASGDSVAFNVEKLKKSMRNSGASEEQIESVVKEITPRLYSGISTKKIYTWAFEILKKGSRHVAAKYHLKSAIMELGPTGFPFEILVAELFKRQGYETKVGIFIKGKCVTHEVDVVVSSETEHYLVECKFHNQQGKNSDVKIPLYIHSRFNDVHFEWLKIPELKNKKIEGWVVTNTRFSNDAIQYAQCSGLNLLGWDYPITKGLKDLTDKYHIYPITTLTSLTKREKALLLESGIILISDLFNKPNELKKIRVSDNRISTVLDEIEKMIGKKKDN